MRSVRLLVVLVSVTFLTSVSGADCVFGDSLVQMARMRDLHTGKKVTLNTGSALSEVQKEQLKTGMDARSVKEAFGITDDGEFWLHDVWDSAHKKGYLLYVYSAGENIHGFIFERKGTKPVAIIGDGSLENCKANYENYDALPWFYTN